MKDTRFPERYYWVRMTELPHSVMLALGFAALVILLTSLARRLPIPTPILQLAAGVAVGVFSREAIPTLDPDLVFFVFLPPVLWAAAYFTSLREFKQNIRSIGLLAIGLVIATTAVVGVVAHALLPGMSWAVALALGAIVSPPDAVAAEAIIKRLPVPRRVLVILEGESLVNDASALVLYRTAVVAAVTGHFSMGEAVVRFFLDAAVGITVGVMVSWLAVAIARRSRDTLALSLLSLVVPYAAWVAGEVLHVSAVLACVAGGIYARQHFSNVISPLARLQNRAVWDVLVFVTNALIFVLLGAAFGQLLTNTPGATLIHIGSVALGISGIVILLRLVWVPIAAWLPRWLSREVRERETPPARKNVGLIAWTSMRGIVSLASALALPLTIGDGSPFPWRTEILLITMVVILITLVVQGLTLAPLIRALRFPVDPMPHIEERHARREALRDGLERLEDLAQEEWVVPEELERLREEYRRRSAFDIAREHDGGAAVSRRRLRAELLRAERRAVVRLRDEGAISDEVLHELERELDVEALRIGAGELG
ncbi:MAG: Na+/H+ antiporter [Gemmatimonadota bacterium]